MLAGRIVPIILYAARVSPQGVLLDPGGIAIATKPDDQHSSAVGFDGTEFAAVWQDYRGGESYDVYGARISQAGGAGAEFDVSLQMEDQITPALATGLGGQVLCTFSGFTETIGGSPANTMRIWAGIHGSSLLAQPVDLSAGAGGTINFDLITGAGNAGRTYVLLGSVSGAAPGTLLPGGLATLPLNRDFETNFIIARLNTPLFANFRGTLDPAGIGAARLNAPPFSPALVGKVAHCAFCLTIPYDYASNPVDIAIVP